MSRRDKLKALREKIEKVNDDIKLTKKIILRSDLSDDDYNNIINSYGEWIVGMKLMAGDVVRYQGKLYEVNQGKDHTAVSYRLPTDKSVFTERGALKTSTGETIVHPFKKPESTLDAYKIGDRVLFNGKVYESIFAGNNTRSPTEYPDAWKLV